jgi:hypothetical protein
MTQSVEATGYPSFRDQLDPAKAKEVGNAMLVPI